MFRNDKKGRLYGIKKDTTFVDNPPLEDNTTKVTRSINFSKSNFLNLGKWILIIVLFLYFGSYTINGFIASNITKNSTEDTLTYEYTKIIGYQDSYGKFDFLQTYDDFKQLTNYVLRVKSLNEINYDYNYFINKYGSFKSCSIYYGYYYRSNNSFELPNSSTNIGAHFYVIQSYYGVYLPGYDGYVYYVSSSLTYYDNRPMYFHLVNSNSFLNNFDIEYARDILNTFYDIEKEIEKIPIYETTTYTYQVKDINYNWDYKLKQISKFRPLFKNDNIYFKNEEYSNLINLNTFIIPTMSSNEYKQKMIEEKILIDEKVIRARDLGVIDSYSFSSYRETSWFNDNDNSFFYLSLNDISSSGNYELTELVYYLNSNYVTNYTKDNYKKLLESDNFGFDDLIIFPIRLVGNLVYNFGVLVGIITIW